MAFQLHPNLQLQLYPEWLQHTDLGGGSRMAGRPAYQHLCAGCAVLLLLLLCASAEPFEGFDDEQAEARVEPADASSSSWAQPEAQGETEGAGSPSQGATASGQGVTKGKQAVSRPPMRFFTPRQQPHYNWEMAAAAFLVLYGWTLYSGRRTNHELALAWSRAVMPLLERNFSLVGHGKQPRNEVLLWDSPSCFKLYATGRRYCQGMLATLNLKPRQDLLMRLWGLVSPSEDTLEVEVCMNEGCVPPIVLVIGTPRAARTLLKEQRDVELYAKKISIGKNEAPWWPADKLQVLAEHSSIFYDLTSEPKVRPEGVALIMFAIFD